LDKTHHGFECREIKSNNYACSGFLALLRPRRCSSPTKTPPDLREVTELCLTPSLPADKMKPICWKRNKCQNTFPLACCSLLTEQGGILCLVRVELDTGSPAPAPTSHRLHAIAAATQPWAPTLKIFWSYS